MLKMTFRNAHIEPNAKRAGVAVARLSTKRGFTLVELLIALVLVAIVTVLMFSSLRLASRTWQGIDNVSERVSDLRIAHNFIERTLRQVRDVRTVVDGVAVPVFGGNAQSLDLVAPLSEHVGIPGLYVLRLGLEEVGKERSLVLVRWLLHPEVLSGGSDYPPWEPLGSTSRPFVDSGGFDKDVASGAYGRTLLLPDVTK